MAILNRYIKLPDDFVWSYIASMKIHASTPYGRVALGFFRKAWDKPCGQLRINP
jgi:hypothetical protein